MADPITPSGLTLNEATRLSKQQQDSLAANQKKLKEGQTFKLDTGELAQYSGGGLNVLGFAQPTFTGDPNSVDDYVMWKNAGKMDIAQQALDAAAWQGKTQAQWQEEANQKALSQLGLSSNNILDLNNDDNYLWRDVVKNLERNKVTDLNQFASSFISPTSADSLVEPPGSLSGGQVQAAGFSQSSQSNIVPHASAPAGYGIDTATGKFAKLPTSTNNNTALPNKPLGIAISNEADLQAKRDELRSAGVPEDQWSKFITSPQDDPTGQGKLYFRQPATLTSPNGKQVVVASGSDEASRLIESGYVLGAVSDNSFIDADLLETDTEINTDGIDDNKYSSTSPSSTIETSNAMSKSIEAYMNLLTPQTDTANEVDELTKSINSLLDDTRGKEDLYNQKLQEQGVNDLRQQLTNVKNEIDIKTAAYQKRLAEIGATPMTNLRRGGAEADATRLMQTDIMFLQAQAQALTNNISFAKEIAQEAVDTKYNPILEEISIKLQQLGLLEGQLSKEEARYSTAVQLALNAQEQAVNEMKNKESQIQQIKLDAIKAGITNADILTRIGNAGSIDEALQIYGTNIPNSGSDLGKFTRIGTDAFGNPTYGFVNESTGVVIPGDMVSSNTQGYVSTSTGEILDIGSYATDPNHENAVQSILNNIGQMTSVEQMDQYIQSVAPGSPITGQMIANASQEHQVSWEGIMAIMQQDSSFGTAGKGARTFNPGNVGNTDSGAEVNYGSWQAGVNAVARNLSRRQVQASTGNSQVTDTPVTTYKPTGNSVLDGLVQNALNNPSLLSGDNKTLNDKQKQAITNELANQGIAIPQQGNNESNKNSLQDKVKQIDEILQHPGLNEAVGPNKLTRNLFNLDEFLNSNRANFVASVSQLISQETIDTLVNLKARGGTLGALSDQERILLRNAATKISEWEVKNWLGWGNKVIGYETTEEEFKKELNKIRSIATRAIENSDTSQLNQDELNQINSIINSESEFNAVNYY